MTQIQGWDVLIDWGDGEPQRIGIEYTRREADDSARGYLEAHSLKGRITHHTALQTVVAHIASEPTNG